MHAPLTPQRIAQILQDRFLEGFVTLKELPLPETLKDIQRAAKRIALAMKQGQRIAVVGDYDVDGTAATALMLDFFEKAGVEVEWIVPNRFEDGYGLSVSVIDKLDRPDLIVTVDNGIAALEAAKECKRRGIELIVTDHHLLPPVLPEAYAIVDPKQPECDFPYDEICGAQIAWYLIAALKKETGVAVDMKALLDIVATAVIADMMPLRHINRTMVQAGLQVMTTSLRPSMRAFLEYIDKSVVTSEDISFMLAPLLNSAGRMEDASLAVRFLRAPNMYEARALLSKLVVTNEKRKRIESELTKAALKQAKTQQGVVVAYGDAWHEGVVGIVAARVARACKRPALVLSRNKEGRLKGSGRSFHGCDLFRLIEPAREFLESFGGHTAAVGLTLHEDHLEAFKTMLDTHYDLQPQVRHDTDVLGMLSFAYIDTKLMMLLARFEPYGTGNPKPKFYTAPIRVLRAKRIGKDEAHVRYELEHDGRILNAVHFKADTVIEPNHTVQVYYTLSLNRFRGETSVELFIEEITPL